MTATHKVLAKSITAQLRAAGYRIGHNHALHLVAALHNLPNWQALEACPHTPRLSEPSATRAIQVAFKRFTKQPFPSEVILDLGPHDSTDPALGTDEAWTADMVSVARLLVLRTQSLSSTGIQTAARIIRQWIRNDQSPFDWRSGHLGLHFVEGVPRGTLVLPDAMTLLQNDWDRVRQHPDLDALVKQVLPELCWGMPPALVNAGAPLRDVAWALAFLAAYRRPLEPTDRLTDEVASLNLAELPGEHLTRAPVPVLAFMEDVATRLLWPQAAHLVLALPPAELKAAQVQGRAHALLQPVEIWHGPIHALLVDLLEVHGPAATPNQLILALQDPREAVHAFGARHPDTEYTETALRVGVRQLRAKLTFPEIRSPWQTTVRITGPKQGTVLYSPNPSIRSGIDFHEDFLYLVQGAHPKEPHQTLSLQNGVLELTHIIRRGEQQTLPKRMVGDLVGFGPAGPAALVAAAL